MRKSVIMPKPGMVHQVSAGIVEKAFQHGGRNQRVRHNRPGIVKMRGDELLQIDHAIAARNGKQLNVVRSGRGIQDAVKDRLDQDQSKSLKEADRRQQQHTRHQLQPKGEDIPQKAGQLPHPGLPMRSQPGPARSGIGIALFYFRSMELRRWSLAFGRWPLTVGLLIVRRLLTRPMLDLSQLRGRFDVAKGQRPTTNDVLGLADDSYFGLSRCTTFTRYPALRRRLPTSSAIMTERCCPPVQPKEIVR